jgi:hypothetical protein
VNAYAKLPIPMWLWSIWSWLWWKWSIPSQTNRVLVDRRIVVGKCFGFLSYVNWCMLLYCWWLVPLFLFGCWLSLHCIHCWLSWRSRRPFYCSELADSVNTLQKQSCKSQSIRVLHHVDYGTEAKSYWWMDSSGRTAKAARAPFYCSAFFSLSSSSSHDQTRDVFVLVMCWLVCYSIAGDLFLCFCLVVDSVCTAFTVGCRDGHVVHSTAVNLQTQSTLYRNRVVSHNQ